jgi:hypothetical protein
VQISLENQARLLFIFKVDQLKLTINCSTFIRKGAVKDLILGELHNIINHSPARSLANKFHILARQADIFGIN